MKRAVAIRIRTAGDDAFIETLSEQAFSEYTPDARARAMPMARAGITLIAVDGALRVGLAVVRRQRKTAYLDAIAVETSRRGHGVGRRLLDAAEREAERAGARRMELVTAEANLSALDLFLKCGYRVVRSVERFYARGQNAHVLDKTLGRRA